MNKTRHYIRTLLLMLLLLLGGTGNDVWAVSVVYKVIDNSGYLAVTSGTVTLSEGADLQLPATYQSALLTPSDFIYYKDATKVGDAPNYGTLWSVKDEDKITDGKLPSGVTTIYVRYKQYDLSNPSLTDDDNTIGTATIKARMKDLGLLSNGFYNIKQGDYYMYKSTWDKQVNTYFGTRTQVNQAAGRTVDTSDDIMGWEFDFNDPYSILIKSRYKEEDIYLTVAGTFADVRIWNLTEAKKHYFWSFILTKGNAAGTLRLMVGNDNFDLLRTEANNQTGQYLNRYNTTKTRYWKNNASLYDLTIVPIGTVRPTFHLVTHYGQKDLTVTTDLQAIKSTINIPTELVRKFCYNYKFYCKYNDDGSVASDWREVTQFPVMEIDESPIDILVTYEVDPTYNSALFNQEKSLLVNNTAVMYNGATITAGAGTLDQMMFKLVGDPYTVQIENKGQGDTKGIGVSYGSSAEQAAGFLTKTTWGYDATFATAKTVVDSNSSDNDPNTFNNNSSGINVWEMINVRNYLSDEFALRQFNTASDPKYLGSNTPLQYQLTTSRMKLAEANFHNYTYHIINRAGVKAISYTISQTEGTVLNYQNLPADIRSPYIADEVLTFRSQNTESDVDIIRITPNSDADIYVRYTTNKLTEKPIKLNGSHAYNMQMSDLHYAITTSEPKVLGKTTGSGDEDEDDLRTQPYFWLLMKEDPYAVEVKNLYSDSFLKYVDTDPDTNPTPYLTLGASDTGTKFILMHSDGDGSLTVQLMAATAKDVSSEDYYCIGLDESNKITVRSKTNNPLGNEKIKITLSSNLPPFTYHIIDKQGKDIIQYESESQELEVPAEIRSPLVDKWQFWVESDFTSTGSGSDITYTLKYDPNTDKDNHLTYLAQALMKGSANIYVTYLEANAIKSGYLATANPREKEELSASTTDGKTTITIGRKYTVPGYDKINMFRLKFFEGDYFYQEDAKDGFETKKPQAVYPYTCGDGAMYIYGEVDWEDQLSKGASTRTRWPWYLVSYNETAAACEDPYHVVITSYQAAHTRKKTVESTTTTTSYYNFFRTYYNTERTNCVSNTIEPKMITTSITDDPLVTDEEDNDFGDLTVVPTEYMILGTMGKFKLLTVDKISDGTTTERRYVESFEQYWKTYETITDQHQYTFDTNPKIPEKNNFYTYDYWANARPDQEVKGDKRFVYEKHYYQTVMMGQEFDLLEVSFDPILVLLDKHGWEIMRKPIPSAKDDDDKRNSKLDAIKAFDSPMVKTYRWYTNATKATGYHKYKPLTSEFIIYQYNESTKKWEDTKTTYTYTSTSLAELPYKGHESQGYPDDDDSNKTDLYVTYDVKEEFANTYQAALIANDVVPQEYLLYQGGNTIDAHNSAVNGYAKAIGETTLDKEKDATLYDKIERGDKAYFDSYSDKDKLLWYAKPNFDIDHEMGYTGDPEVYTLSQNGFDPYNVQIQSKKFNTYLTTNATAFSFDADATWTGDYLGTPSVSLEAMTDDPNGVFTAIGYDQVILKITNATFMVVSDKNGNMRLMPRFDHKNVLDTDFKTLKAQESWADVPAKDRDFKQTIDFMRPVEFQYYIIDNEGFESLRYKGRLGQHEPELPEHFKSPFAKDFKFYGGAYEENGKYIIDESTSSETSEDEITSTFGAAGLLNDHTDVYIRYAYDEEKDVDRILQGNWLTMKLYSNDVKYDSGINTGLKPNSEPLMDRVNWSFHWKFLIYPKKMPDPYDVQVLNRAQKDLPMTIGKQQIGTSTTLTAQAEKTENTYQHFALLKHIDDNTYALAVAGTESNDDYYFISGSSFPAITEKESSFSSLAAKFDGTKSEIKLSDDIGHKYTYKVIRNDKIIAATAEVQKNKAEEKHYTVSLPEDKQSPLLNESDYLYYAEVEENNIDTSNPNATYTVKESSEIPTLLGLYGQYDEGIYVRYKEYDEHKSPYRVTNRRNSTGASDIGAEGDPIHPIDLSDHTIYNIIWAGDNMMYNNNSSLAGSNKHELTNDTKFVWTFAGNDPYDIKLKNNNMSVYSSDLSASALNSSNATSFMMLKKDGYDYGVLAVSGYENQEKLMQNYDGTIGTTSPTKFYIFALTTNLTYRLYFHETSKRSETYIDYLAGPIGVGKKLEVPQTIGRPLCTYNFKLHNTDTPIEYLPTDYFGMSEYIDIYYDPETDIFLTNTEAATASTGGSVTKWRTLDDETNRVNFIYTRATLATLIAEDTHYTNDYLWCPEGDPYGFYLHNRYAAKNGNGWGEVMTTVDTPAEDATLTLSTTKTNAVYEMLYADDPTSFKLHPRTAVDGLLVYNDNGIVTLSSTNSTDWKLSLTKEQLKPYFDRNGYVGGLQNAKYEEDDSKALHNALNDGTATQEQLKSAQELCYTDENIINLFSLVARPDYYSIHDATSTPRYISGYTHYLEQQVGLNLHYHEQAIVQTPTTYGEMVIGTYQETAATRGDIPLEAALYDPASIFYFNPLTSSQMTMSTQGLYVNTEGTATKMTTTPQNLTWMDIGGALVMLRVGNDITTGYLAPDPILTMTIGKGTDNELADNAKWCLQPVDKKLPLRLITHPGKTRTDGSTYHFATFYAPFDVELPNTAIAYICTTWDKVLHLKNIGRYNTVSNLCPEKYRNKDYFVPAGTPVIIRTNDVTEYPGYIDLELAVTSEGAARYPSTYTAAKIAEFNVFEGQYLEKNLGVGSTVYTFGQAYTDFTLDTGTGEVSGTGSLATTPDDVVGFYINANPYCELDPDKANWTRNNWYVYHNKMYCRQVSSGSRELTRSPEFIPVVFDDEEGEEDEPIEDSLRQQVFNGCVYDLQGRCVATEEMVKDGTWRHNLTHGIYILNGKKIYVK